MKIKDIWDNYDTIIENMFEEIEKDFKSRNDIVKLELDNNKVVELKKNNLLTNIILWCPFADIDNTKFSEECILDLKNNHINNDLIFDYFDRIILLFEDCKDLDKLKLSLAKSLHLLDRISRRFNSRIGNSISLYSLVKLSQNVPEVNDFFHFHLDEDKSSNENEHIIEEATKRLVKLMKENENCIQDYLNSGEGINVGQMGQMILSSSYKSNLSGQVYPVPINTNLLRGFRSVTDYVLDATAGRKSMVITFNQVRRSGLQVK